MFRTNDTDCINDIHHFMGYLPLVPDTDDCSISFLDTGLSL